MLPSLTPDQIRSIAPDSSAARAGEGLSARRHWSGVARSDRAAWGLCQGSGKDPYRVVVDLAGPAFNCSCPSRKFPCKHALGLMHLLAVDPGAVAPGEAPPGWAADWLSGRAEREAASAARAETAATRAARAVAGEGTDEDRAAASAAEASKRRRTESRERKVDAGLADLDRWLDDLVRRGLLAAKGEGYAFWDRAGARLVDAQAASLGREVRALGAATNRAAGWAESALERLGRIHLIIEGYRRADALPDGLRADVRSLVGWTIKEDELPPDGDVTDRWLALGRTVTSDERLTTARTWLLGETTGRFALHLAFQAGEGNPLPIAVAGSAARTTLRFYPSAVPLRAIAPAGAGEPAGRLDAIPGAGSIGDAAAAFAGVLARNPFITAWPVVIGPVVPIGSEDGLRLRDATGAAIDVKPAAIAARLVALAGGRTVTVFGLWSGRSIRVLSAVAEGRFVDLAADTDEGELVMEPVPGGDTGHSPGEPAEPGTRAPDYLEPAAWSRLVSSALLGTERTAGVRIALPPSFEPVAERSGERRLLAAAAVTALASRAGWQPAVADDAPVEAAPDDVRPTVGSAAAWILRRILDETPELVPEWLERARGVDRRPPDDELPRLLLLAAHRPVVRAALAPLLGPRATWLVAQMPRLAAGMPAASAGPGAPDPIADPDGFREAWEAQPSAPQRVALLADARARDRAAGRAAIAAIWDAASTEERAAVIETLDDGLEAADEPVLTRAWGDRRSEVRAAAEDRLARLPDSAFARLADAVGRPCLHSVGRGRPSIEAELPAWTEDLGRLGIVRKAPTGIGERSWWLRQIVARVAPARWAAWLDTDAKGLVERSKRSEEAGALLVGLVEAAGRFRDADLAAAILADHELLGREDVQSAEPFALVRHLPSGRADELAAGIIGAADASIAGAVARELPAPWSPHVSWAVTAALARSPGPASGWLPVPVRDLARLAARRVASSGLAELERTLEVVAGTAGTVGTPMLNDAFDLVRLRLQLDAAFAAEKSR